MPLVVFFSGSGAGLAKSSNLPFKFDADPLRSIEPVVGLRISKVIESTCRLRRFLLAAITCLEDISQLRSFRI
jgi:hypothetical protein